MAQVIQIKRRIPGTGKPASGTGATQVTAGELATSISATGATGVAELYIGDGTYVHDLVSSDRQVELEGAQTINGAKTIGPTGSLTTPLANIHINGGTTGQVLSTTNGTGTLAWLSLPEGLITTFDTTETYAVGDFVMHGGHIYRANTAVTAGSAFDGDDWDQIATMADLEDYLPLTGGTLIGNLNFASGANITSASNFSITPGGTGSITLSSAQVLLLNDPTVNLGVATKQYVDGQIGTASAVSPFSDTVTYPPGSFVLHATHMYRAHTLNGPGTFDGDDWDRVANLDDLDAYVTLATAQTITGAKTIGATGGLTTPVANIHINGGTTGQVLSTTNGAGTLDWMTLPEIPIEAFSATETYAVGEFVIHNGHLWRAHTANGPAAWSATNWDRIATVDEFDDYVTLATAQTITGAKTIGATGGLTTAVGNIHINGGATGQVLSTTNGAGTLSWLTLPEGLVRTFDAAETYAVGDFVIHGGHMYRANTTVAAGAWDGDDWDQVAIASDLENYVTLATAQTITGAKTIGATGGLTVPVANLHVGGGTTGQVLSTNGSGTNSWLTLPEGLITTFDAAETYAVGDFVMHGGHVYRANTSIAAGAFDGDDWDRIANMDDLDAYVTLATAQTISGAKTIGATGGLTTAVGNIHINGGATGQVLSTTNGAGTLGWVTLPEGLVRTFSATETYAIGDFVMHGGHMYRANAVNSGAWDADDWDQVVIATDLDDYVTLAGTQTITGAKTIGATGGLTVPVANLHIGGGATGQVLSTNGSGTNSWLTLPEGLITTFDTAEAYAVGDFVMHGGHVYRANVAVAAGAFNANNWDRVATLADIDGVLLSDLAVAAPLHGNGLTGATGDVPLGVTMATTTQVDGGTDTVYPISAATLRSQIIGGTGGVSSLTTTNKLVVPAINELNAVISALSGAIRLVGTYDADDDEVTAPAGSPAANGAALPAAAAVNEGWYVIVDTAGDGNAHTPNGLAAGDWLVSTGSAWVHIPLNIAHMAASNISITQVDSQAWTTVQAALQGIFTRITTAGNTPILADHVSILGDGTSTTPLTASAGELRVGLLDGGTF